MASTVPPILTESSGTGSRAAPVQRNSVAEDERKTRAGPPREENAKRTGPSGTSTLKMESPWRSSTSRREPVFRKPDDPEKAAESTPSADESLRRKFPAKPETARNEPWESRMNPRLGAVMPDCPQAERAKIVMAKSFV